MSGTAGATHSTPHLPAMHVALPEARSGQLVHVDPHAVISLPTHAGAPATPPSFVPRPAPKSSDGGGVTGGSAPVQAITQAPEARARTFETAATASLPTGNP